MADLPPYSTPRWVKLVGIIALILVLLLGILHLTGSGGNHGPSRHLPSGTAGDTPPFSIRGGQTSFGSGYSGYTRPIHHGVHRL